MMKLLFLRLKSGMPLPYGLGVSKYYIKIIDIHIDTCAICKNQVQDPCIQCQSIQDSGKQADCTIAWGVCNHTFHYHCISKWIMSRAVCPLDNKEWKFQENNNTNTNNNINIS